MPLACGSLFASFLRALTVIGGIGYASQYGWAFMTLYTTGTMAGMMFLSLTAKKWHHHGGRTRGRGLRLRRRRLRPADNLPVHEIIPAIVLSIAAMVVVTLLTDRSDDRNLAPIFEDIGPAGRHPRPGQLSRRRLRCFLRTQTDRRRATSWSAVAREAGVGTRFSARTGVRAAGRRPRFALRPKASPDCS